MKNLLLVLSMLALLSACVQGGVKPPSYFNVDPKGQPQGQGQDPCPQGKYWSESSKACQEWPKSL